MDLNEFMKKSLSLVDSQDLEREFNEVEMRYAAKIASKDMEISELDGKLKSINKRTSEIEENNSVLKNNLKLMRDALED